MHVSLWMAAVYERWRRASCGGAFARVLCAYCVGIFGLYPVGYADNPTLLVPETSFEVTRFEIDEDEIKVVESLIATTEEQLKKQHHLKELMLQFHKYKEEFVQGNQTKAHAGRLVRLARQIYELILANHFDHLFAKDYLEELQFFSSIAGKTTLSRP